ncbi:hypothetical protein A3C21_00655 [Candidatus Kaiserbacteria bacterium RIFCSPHIGHO2_02_FULL_59_21]|uniref:DUF8173 domain-containing protein n=1 Tax=Candidatus Kaiserbacteria bacterium RIFCSPHIGHO2_02_FULL_59_21 TaxID=1798500 RepID=A0A1F6E028_9BACT|nr:MAG: hypothetical protein A2766_01865 [Candidatus Kaiserbacteria bacterium RIFCSPHIGHO2_01_FULL_58_22]OGG66910.1 MAG: hypothetical protein A3C21_00655 [Candidatus Kaiserbacteria bacterium RIFCSPHIGHO2_02_FULL_59_21]OGG80476.1 MAG: hypothetical protein A2952_01720 [Candidatus Kaiserbacteria bacterium RIFCSPLOWO2_01_FULL_59_34]OGG86634.1 MAG: hypothetical protein A3I47_02710 [Candidatus Kaiserbacteria bacterium RIFCSPLOWO2_02_FULL_59_19]
MAIKKHYLGALALALVGIAAFLPYAGRAAEIRTGDQPSIGVGERVGGDLYIAGGNITSAGVVTADLAAAGGNILVSGGVGGDVAVAGGSIAILGNVADDVRAAGGSLLVQGGVGGDLVLLGGQLNVGGSGVKGDLLAGGGTIRVDAPIGGDVRISGGDVYLNSAVGGDVEVFAEKLTLGSAARIAGSLSYTAAREAVLAEGAAVAGETTFKKRERTISVAGAAKVISLALIGTFLSQLAAALLLGLFFRRYVLALVEAAVARPLLETGRGLVVIIVLPVLSFMLLFTVIGVPLGILGFISFAAALLFLWILTPVLLGSLAHQAFFKGEYGVSWKTILLGVFIYSVLGLIPIVGWLTQFLLTLLTLGVAAKAKWSIVKEWR